MSTPEFATAENNQELAQEVNCLKSLLTLMLQAMGQADAGRVHSAVFSSDTQNVISVR